MKDLRGAPLIGDLRFPSEALLSCAGDAREDRGVALEYEEETGQGNEIGGA